MSLDRRVHMRLEPSRVSEALAPRLEPRQARPLDRIGVPAIAPDADANIGQRERLASEIVAARQLALYHFPILRRALASRLEGGGIALFRRRAVIAQKHKRHRRRNGRYLPIHPASDMAALFPIRRMKMLAAMLGTEIAADRARFPDDEVAIPDRRH